MGSIQRVDMGDKDDAHPGEARVGGYEFFMLLKEFTV